MTASADADTERPIADDDPAALAGAVLAEEASRQAEQRARDERLVLPDDLLPGVGDDPLPLRDAVRGGGLATLVVLPLISVVEEFERVAFSVLAPDIQKSLDVSDTTLAGIAVVAGVSLTLGAAPLAQLADRMRRTLLGGIATVFWGAALILQAIVVNPFQMFWARVLTGLGQSNKLPVHSSLLSDAYPVQARARVFALEGLSRPVGLVLGPLLAGSIANAVGGGDSWRWVFVAFAIPPILLGLVLAVAVREPKRGAHEAQRILGAELGHLGDVPPVSMASAYARLKKIKTFYFICVGIGVLGFALVAVPLQLSQLLENSYHYGAYTRGWVLALTWVASLIAIPIAGTAYDRLFRADPERMVRLAGGFVLAYGVLMTVALRFTSIAVFVALVSVANACTSAAFVAIGPIVGAVAPIRMRAQAFAIIPVFIFLMGGFFGGLIAGALSDAHGERTALSIVVAPAALVGGSLILRGTKHLRRDISLAVDELIEERDELERMTGHRDEIPRLQVRNLDFSYGPVQVLFDVGFEVRVGETLALLGTNGAGKSTVLRAISGLGIPDRGVVRLDGRTVTYVEPEVRFGLGIVQLRGGAGVFADSSVRDNLRTAVLAAKLGAAEERRRTERVLGLFPILADRQRTVASDLSGGQQQMLALAMALMHEPAILLIDELSLGLAPVVVQELLRVVEQLRERGQTIIVVEQSLNVALAIADRAVFMEKGRVRFDGPAADLARRGDLVRAVFLGAEGG